MIPRETIDEIKARADLLEVVGDYVNLKKAGSNYRGLSPFNQERTPSFYVVPSKGFFKDFSSGKAGDAITFLMEAEGMNYLEAIKHLAKKYGIEIAEEAPTDEQLLAQNERESLFIVMKFANAYFQQLLWENEEGQAIGLSYFKERGFSEETIREFGLGYSLDAWDGLLKEATAKGHNPTLLEKAGLVVKKEAEGEKPERSYDRFRGRVMFPVHNISGRVLAFGARILGNKTERTAKYINSPETLIYHKSDVLYGLYQAKQFIRQEDTCYLVEGYTDVISLHQAGIKNVVASSGTSLTHEQIRLIARYTKNVTVLFDGDAAGLKASFRGIDMLLEGGLNVRAVVLPEGEDPDTLARQLRTGELRDYLTDHQEDFIAFKTAIFQRDAKADPIRQAELIREVVGSIAKVPDPIQRQVYVKTTGQRLDIDEAVLFAELNKIHIQQQRSEARRASQNLPSEVFPGIDSAEAVDDGTPPALPEPAAEVGHAPPYYQERGVTRLLVLYGDYPVDDETKVCHYIFSELADIDLQTEVYAQIFARYRALTEQGVSVTEERLIGEGDEVIAKEVIDMVVDHYVLSENWEVRHNIYVPQEKDVLHQAIEQGILELKFVHLNQLLQDTRQQLLNETDETTQIKILQNHQLLKRTQMEIADLLGIVVS
jgi:DNA primase